MIDLLQQRTAISIGEAIKKVMRDDDSQPVEIVELLDSANRFLTEDLIAQHPVPAFDRSLYDGYAIRAADTYAASKQNPVLAAEIEEKIMAAIKG